MSQSAYIRDDEADIRVTVDGVQYGDGNSWATYEGAALVAAGSKTRPGGMGKEKEIGSFASRGNCTVTIQNSDSMIAQHPTLESRIGKGDVVIAINWLDDEGNLRTGPGARFSVTGKLLQANLPGGNFDSAATGMYTIVGGLDELAGS